VSNYMHDVVEIGTRLTVNEIDGNFSIFMESVLPTRLCMFSAGIGVTPMIAMLRQLVKVENLVMEIVLLHSDRCEEEDVVFGEELKELKKKLNLKVIYSLTKSGKRIHQQFVEEAVPEISKFKVYLCGPNGFMKNIVDILKCMDYKDKINTEYFDY
jgi:ferredoxin-NADP reductase